VWAPRASRTVEVVEGDRRTALVPEDRERGTWAGEVPGLGPGDDYGFSLDGGPVRPDPRSRHQPHGVDGPSRVVDPGAFAWSDGGWRGFDLARAVLYEVHVGTFSPEGTFDGAIGNLGHLVDLGVDAVELMPVAEFPGRRGWGYDGVDLWAPHDAYGGPDGLRRLVDACHARGLGVLADVVYNHLGPVGNYQAEFGPYFDEARMTNWGPALNLDGPGSDGVRSFVVDNARMWLRDYHLDGLRLDAVHALLDDSAVHLLEQLSTEVRGLAAELGRPLWLIGESDLNAPRFVRPPDHGGYGLDATWADEWHHALHAALTGERDGYYADFGPLPLLAKALRQAWVYDGIWSPQRRRTFGRPPTGLHGAQFVVSAQNHDQIGNRAAGERLGHLVGPGQLRTAAELLLSAPFVPLLFQGEEWAASTPFPYFTDYDADLGAAVRDGRAREFATFGWRPADIPDPQDPATFASAVLRWEERDEPEHAAMLAWYRELIARRRADARLAAGPLDDTEVDVDEAAGRLVVRRRAAGLAIEARVSPGRGPGRTPPPPGPGPRPRRPPDPPAWWP
jgi:maltooligosyltrehalose trehalohydrolase